MRKNITIRREHDSDINQINFLHKTAFFDHPFSINNEDIIIDKLRNQNGITLSLVADYKNIIIGNVIFSLLIVGGHLSNWNLLGPLAVLPKFQKQGIGSVLVRYGLNILKSTRYDGCALLGDLGYYHKFGFMKSKSIWHKDIPQNFILEQPFSQKKIHGFIRFHQAFYTSIPSPF